MRSVAEWLIGAFAASAKRNGGFALQVKFISCSVEKFKLAFNSNGAVIFYCDLCGHFLRLSGVMIVKKKLNSAKKKA
jgi:hypothetical protein